MGADLSSGEDNTAISSINVTPFVDVVLVLLVIFMVTAPAIIKSAIGIKLPKASAVEAPPQQTLGVAINRQGQVLLDGKLVLKEEMQAKVKTALELNSELRAIISADEEARHGDVVRAIDWIKSAGLEKFAVEVKRE